MEMAIFTLIFFALVFAVASAFAVCAKKHPACQPIKGEDEMPTDKEMIDWLLVDTLRRQNLCSREQIARAMGYEFTPEANNEPTDIVPSNYCNHLWIESPNLRRCLRCGGKIEI